MKSSKSPYRWGSLKLGEEANVLVQDTLRELFGGLRLRVVGCGNGSIGTGKKLEEKIVHQSQSQARGMVCLVVEQRLHCAAVIHVFKRSCHHIELIKILRRRF